MIQFISFVAFSKCFYTHRNQFDDEVSLNHRETNRTPIGPRFNQHMSAITLLVKKTECPKWKRAAVIALAAIALFAVTALAVSIYSLIRITAGKSNFLSVEKKPCYNRFQHYY